MVKQKTMQQSTSIYRIGRPLYSMEACVESAHNLQQGCKPSSGDRASNKPATTEFHWSQHQRRKEDGVHHQTFDRTKLVFISCILKNNESPIFTISSTSYPHNLKEWNRLQQRLLENYYLVRSKDSTTP